MAGTTDKLTGRLSGVGGLTGSLTLDGQRTLKGQLTVPEGGIGPVIPVYSGPYSVTPSDVTQTLSTDGKQMADNVVIGPIPGNYGRIAWTGSTLFVS